MPLLRRFLVLIGITQLICTGLIALQRREPVHQRVLIQAIRDQAYDFYILDLDGTIDRRIRNEGKFALETPIINNNRLFFRAMDGYYSVSLAGGMPRYLTDVDAIPSEVFRPYFSPDGDWISFVEERDNQKLIRVIPAAEGEPSYILRTGVDSSEYINVWWSSDSEWLFYNTASLSSLTIPTIYRIHRTGGEAKPFAEGSIQGMDRENNRLLVQRVDIFWLSEDGEQEELILSEGDYEAISPIRYDLRKRWMLVRANKPNGMDIYRINLDNREDELLFQTELIDGWIGAVSPSGQSIIIQTGNNEFYRLTREKPEPEQLTAALYGIASSIWISYWAEDDTLFFQFYNATSFSPQLARLSPGNTNLEILSEPDSGFESFSPDMQWGVITYQIRGRTFMDNKTYLSLTNLRTGEVTALTDSTYSSDFQAWLPKSNLPFHEARLGILGSVLLGLGILPIRRNL